ncbi:hypothetical protein [Flavobacterium sp.]|uniref:hypothetical protein n=1 Tax=Flavobacterium sp. TaxID=239 RepID=UPI00286DAAAA|nr:hypothetical protein [Flavobacterium sp.]
MAKGVKKIDYQSGKIDMKISRKTKIIALANEPIVFGVTQWEAETTEADKQKGVTWIWQTPARKVIGKLVVPASQNFKFTIPKHLCGAYPYYLEASLSGKTDVREIGLYVMGSCTSIITKAQWSTAPKGSAITSQVSFGTTIFLDLATEGLNGYKGLSVEIYKTEGDKLVTTIKTPTVVDGKTTLEVKTTFWQILQPTESFYVKIKHPNTGNYVPDISNNEKHTTIQVSNGFAMPSFLSPTNITPYKIGKPNVNHNNASPCRYDKLIITDKDSNKDVFETEIYDAVKNKNILIYETIAGSSESSKKELKLSYKKFDNKQCFSKVNHKKEVEIFIDGEKQKAEVISSENVTVNLMAKANTVLLRTNPELFFIIPDSITKYQIIAKTCAQPAGILNVNVYPNVERELAFVLTLFKSYNRETNVKDVKTGDGGVNRIGKRDVLTGYNGEKGMKLVDGQLEILEQKKGGLGFGLQAKVKVDNITSSIELGTTKNQIKELIGFYNTIVDLTKDFNGKGRENESLAFRQGKYPKATFDLEAPNVALALRITNKKVIDTSKVVKEYSGGLALKPITGIKIGVDLISLIPYFGLQGKIVSWLLEAFTQQANIEIYIIFELSFQARAEFNLAYNEIEGLKAGEQKLELEAAVTGKVGIKSREKVTLTIVTSDGTTDKAQVEKFKGEGSIISGLMYTYNIKGDKKGMYSQHKLEFTGMKVNIVVFALNQKRQFHTYFKKEFTIIEKPVEPWFKSDKKYL